ncbi:hypothetical protein H072_5448 [Dactylellina haptotyla CBS 200.50]|uniref:Ribose-5-phosphate isomerase n=1 Tax=Dactylellina haptotyla (strain CBS 200.50) TaxID=1284197 RepID=S8ACM5_DACHA|nr:hypothetical protein H072_5448 [Dactylellina haptotyla CBS 200.50]
MSLVPPNNIQSLTFSGIVPSLVIIYILRNFYVSRRLDLGKYDPALERMEKILHRVRSRSLRKKASQISVQEKSPEDHKDIEFSKGKEREGLKEIDDEVVPEDEDSRNDRIPNDQLSISHTPPGAYGSAVSLDDAHAIETSNPIERSQSRRSSLSRPRKKQSAQHVDFQSPELEATTPRQVISPPPVSILSGRTASTRRSKRERVAGMVPSLVSLFSTGGTSKPPRTVRRLRSTSSVRRLAAYKAVDDNFPTTKPAYVAIGSGSLLVQVVERISQFSYSQLADVTFVSTGVASEHIMASYKLRPITALNLLSPETKIDVYFDTADEVDDGLNCIRGATGNLHLERMVALRTDCFVCIIDYHKRVPTLFTSGKSMAVEVTPESYFHVIRALRTSNATVAPRRGEPAILGLCTTQRGTYLLDVTWPALRDSSDDVERLAEMTKGIYGVVDHGLFYSVGRDWNGRPNKVYVGLEDGAVDVLGTG